MVSTNIRNVGKSRVSTKIKNVRKIGCPLIHIRKVEKKND